MNEPEWISCQNPDALLSFVLGRTTERKLRLCAAACTRRVWPSPAPPPRFPLRSSQDLYEGTCWFGTTGPEEGKFCWPNADPAPVHQAADAAERFADGQASDADLRACFDVCRSLADKAQDIAGWANYRLGDHYGVIEMVNARQTVAGYLAATFACATSMTLRMPQHRDEMAAVLWPDSPGEKYETVRQAVRAAGLAAFNPGGLTFEEDGAYGAAAAVAGREEPLAQCELLRDILGNPFRPVSLDPSWLPPIAVSLAQAAYDGRNPRSGELDPARLAVLADALEEAGCTDPQILGHLRGPGPHVRGCFVADLILGRR